MLAPKYPAFLQSPPRCLPQQPHCDCYVPILCASFKKQKLRICPTRGVSNKQKSVTEREAIINRLLQERDLRLSSPAEGQGLGATAQGRRDKRHTTKAETGACSDDGVDRSPSLGREVAGIKRDHRHRLGDRSVVVREVSDGYCTGDDGGTSVNSSPDSCKGNVFFASDLPDITSGGGGGDAADGEAAPGKVLDLLRLQDRDTMSIPSTNENNNSQNNSSSSSRSWSEGEKGFLQELDHVCGSSIPETPPSAQRPPTHPRESLRTDGSTSRPTLKTELRLHPEESSVAAANNGESDGGGVVNSAIFLCLLKKKMLYSCEIEGLVETRTCKLCVILRSRVSRSVCVLMKDAVRRLPLSSS